MVDSPETPAGAGEERPPRGPQESSPRGSPGEPKMPPRAPPPPTAAPTSRLAYLRPRPARPALPAAADHPATAARRGPRSRHFRAPTTASGFKSRQSEQPLRGANLELRLRPPRRNAGAQAPPPGRVGHAPRVLADLNLTPATPPGPRPLPST